jgi:arginyl-tRNA synthetase
LGASLARIFRAQGCTVIGVNHLGDWGTQCGYQFLAWRRADPAERERRLAAEGLDYLAELYVEINAPAKRVAALEERNRELPPGSSETRATLEAELAQVRPEAENLDAEARALFRRLEDGDPELRALWERFRKTTLEVLQKSYDRLGVRFESDAGEGFYEPFLKPLIAELKARGVLEQSEGAWVIALDEPGAERKRPPFIVVKSDGATKYEARDLAAALYRKRQYDFAQNLYVVDVRQSEHFKNLFRALEKCGHAWAKDCHHVSYGMMKIKEGDSVLPMTTRGGRMIPLQELLDRMRDIVRRIVEEKNPELPAARKDAVAEAVGVGAIVFWIQSRRRDSHILFDWRQATNPDGDTGPYVQYTHARACSILRKAEAQPACAEASAGRSACAEASAGRSACASGAAGRPPPSLELSLLVQPEETAVAKELERFPAVLREAAENYEPSMIGGWLIVVSRAFNDFYHRRQVLKAETPELRAARLALVDCVRGLLAQGLSLLGMAAPEEM